MKLLVFPGGGNPSHQKYQSAYRLFKNEAPRYGYDEIDVSLRWPGHFTADVNHGEELTFDAGVSTALDYLREHEQQDERFDIVARSFGTLVSAQCAVDIRFEKLRKLILWGAPPFWLFWEMWVRDLDRSRKEGLAKGIQIGESFFSTLVPFEELIQELSYPVLVAGGSEDDFSPPAFRKYLKSLVSEKQNVVFDNVDGASHVVDGDSRPSVKE
ncbi:MAG: alpha/beta fold hydrolase, partial [Halobacteriaceae archaeon]